VGAGATNGPLRADAARHLPSASQPATSLPRITAAKPV
jgi:hypothetical protein